jgi:hypothetical protein
MTETLQKLYLELANVVPASCLSSREIKQTEALAELMIRHSIAIGQFYTFADLLVELERWIEELPGPPLRGSSQEAE